MVVESITLTIGISNRHATQHREVSEKELVYITNTSMYVYIYVPWPCLNRVHTQEQRKAAP